VSKPFALKQIHNNKMEKNRKKMEAVCLLSLSQVQTYSKATQNTVNEKKTNQKQLAGQTNEIIESNAHKY
jgi:hypothetical protein